MKTYKLLFIVLGCALPAAADAQRLHPKDYHSNTVSVQSPTSGSLGKYGDVPVNMFTGIPNIDVPLTGISYGPISVPVSLSYNASGIRVAEQAGWAGLGWDLVCGGQITRKVNGIQDEFSNANPNFVTTPPFIDKGYYFTGSDLDNSQWNTTAFMTTKLNNYNALDYGIWKGLALDGEPDEFQFSFGSYSGSFYRSEKGEWKVKSKQNLALEITHDMVSNASYRLYQRFNPYNDDETDFSGYEFVGSLFTKFTIVTPDGFKYVFGEDTAAIEFSRGPIGGRPGQENFSNLFMEDRKNYITANTWHLTSIVAPTGESITLKYKRGKAIFHKIKTYTPGFQDGTTYADPVQTRTATAVNPSYLQSVETPLKRIDFVTSLAQELGPSPWAVDISPSNSQPFKKSITTNYTDLDYAYTFGTDLPNFNRQLDSVKVFDKTNGQYVSGYVLHHSTATTRRRTLDSLKAFTFNGGPSTGTYKFTYSNVADLPRYESLCRDHYGFYNGGTEPAMEASAFPSRAPGGFALYGMLSKITYPTGGETMFEFEPGTYSSVVKFDPASVQLLSENGTAGVRIKKITNIPNYGAPPMTTEYSYIKGGASSGVLGIKLPYTYGYHDVIQYQIDWGGLPMGSDPNCNGTFIADNFSDNGSEWVELARGGIITYSEVKEKKGDGSFTVYKYSNSDQPQYRDELHDNYAYANAAWLGANIIQILQNSNFRVSSNDLERGNLLTQETYNSSGTKVQDLQYTYEDDPARKNNFIKAFAHKELYTTKQCGSFRLASVPRGWTYKVYCYNNPVKTVVAHTYETSGTLTNTTTYTYDAYGNTVQTDVQTSDGRVATERTRYNSNSAYLGATLSPLATHMKALFTNYGIKNMPVEKVSSIAEPGFTNEQITGGVTYEYNHDQPLLTRVLQLELAGPFASGGFVYSGLDGTGNFARDSRYKEVESIGGYTNATAGSSFKPLSIASVSKGNEAYTWDHAGQFVTSVTHNAGLNKTAYINFESGSNYATLGVTDANKGNWDFNKNNIVTEGFTGRKSLFLTSADEVTTTVPLTNGKRYILSFWMKGSPPGVKLGGSLLPMMYATTKQVGQWQFFRIPLVGNGTSCSVVPYPGGLPNITLDEVRLYPEDGIMNSYNYDPALGTIISTSNERDEVTFYEYDAYGRLIQTKDETGHLLNHYAYVIQGAQ